MEKNKYLALSTSLGLVFGAFVGMLINMMIDSDNFMFSLPIGAGFGMLIGIVIGSILDTQHKK